MTTTYQHSAYFRCTRSCNFIYPYTNQNGGEPNTKETPATNNTLQETDRKTQGTMERLSERRRRRVTRHTGLEN
jgi:hypothetical protein